MSGPIKIQLTQETVDHMVQGLASQGWGVCKDVGGTGVCLYYREGTRCAVGWLISEEEAKTLPRSPVSELPSRVPVEVADAAWGALIALQSAHDSSLSPEDMRSRVKAWCENYGYQFNEVANG
jgi:hypothetical protein